jgi:cell division protein FtsL
MARETRINGSYGEQVRVYAPSDGALAYREDYPYRTARLAAAPAHKPEPQTRPDEHKKPHGVRIPNLLEMARQNHFFVKFLAVCCIVAVAAVAALAVVRFVRIADMQNEINALNSEIQATERAISDLDFSSQPTINATEFASRVGLVPARP